MSSPEIGAYESLLEEENVLRLSRLAAELAGVLRRVKSAKCAQGNEKWKCIPVASFTFILNNAASNQNFP